MESNTEDRMMSDAVTDLYRLDISLVVGLHRSNAWPFLHHSQRITSIYSTSWPWNDVFQLLVLVKKMGDRHAANAASLVKAQEQAPWAAVGNQ
jgi:hypothetical protein